MNAIFDAWAMTSIYTAEVRMRSLVLAILLLATTQAVAAIRIINSTYQDGTLTVTGQTRPDQRVSLDGKYNTTADTGGHFEFHVRYKPQTCMADITAGDDSYSAVITNCLLDDAATSNEAR